MYESYIKRHVPNHAVDILENYADEHNLYCRWMSACYLELIVVENDEYDLSFCIDETFEDGKIIIEKINITTYISSIHKETDEKIFSEKDYEKVEKVGLDFLRILFTEK